jgi:hypothetical protein
VCACACACACACVCVCNNTCIFIPQRGTIHGYELRAVNVMYIMISQSYTTLILQTVSNGRFEVLTAVLLKIPVFWDVRM